jgi:uncharacterized circularly permuted ATP-grasp superfamily protein
METTVTEPLEEGPSAFTADAWNEGFDPDGAPRRGYAELFALGRPALAEVGRRCAAALAERGVVFGGSDPRPFDIDPVPRIIGADEWEGLQHGLIQRTRALNAFLADAYGERRIVDAGVLPARVIEEAEWYEPAMAAAAGGDGGAAVGASVAGPDLVRDANGGFVVLEDNLRAPSGLTYLLAAREILAPLLAASGLRPRGLDRAVEELGAAIRAAAPAAAADPCVVLLSDGPRSSPYYEHRELARRLGAVLATAADLRREGTRLMVRRERGHRQVDVIYRRVDDERLSHRDGTVTPLGELLIEPLRAGTLGCANSPGSGLADDKAIHTYVDRMIAFYLDEPVLVPSVPGYDLGDPEQLALALPRIGELVIKPRSEFGGQGVVLGPLARPALLERTAAAVRAEPRAFVAQEPVPLSLHPTVMDGSLSLRHVDLRPFVLTAGTRISVIPGGLTRFARVEGEMVVNSGRGGGAKDTWII